MRQMCWVVLIFALFLVGAQVQSRAADKPHPTADSAGDVSSIRIARSYGWLPMSATHMVLWTGIEEPYLVIVASECPDLLATAPRGMSTHDRRITVNIDRLLLEQGDCKIVRMQRADRATLAARGIRREQARTMPLVPANHKTIRTK